MRLPEGLLEQDVEEGLRNRVLTVDEAGVVQRHGCLGALVDGDHARLVIVRRLHGDGVLKRLQRGDHLTGGDVGAEQSEQAYILILHNVVHDGCLEDLIMAHRQSILVHRPLETNVQQEMILAERHRLEGLFRPLGLATEVSSPATASTTTSTVSLVFLLVVGCLGRLWLTPLRGLRWRVVLGLAHHGGPTAIVVVVGDGCGVVPLLLGRGTVASKLAFLAFLAFLASWAIGLLLLCRSAVSSISINNF